MGEVRHLPVLGREFFIDDSGTVLRASWHLDRGLVNFSIWRGDRCTETFHLPVEDAARLIGYLAEGLSAGASTASTQPTTTSPRGDRAPLDGVRDAWRDLTAPLGRLIRPARGGRS